MENVSFSQEEFQIPSDVESNVFENLVPLNFENRNPYGDISASHQGSLSPISHELQMPTSLSENIQQEANAIRRETAESSKRLPKWYLRTFQDIKNDEILPERTRRKAKETQEVEQQTTNCVHEEGMFDDNYDQIMSVILNDAESISMENALKDNHWMCAMKDELKSITENRTWDLVELPNGKEIIGTKWIFKIKKHAYGTINRYKARLVAKGYTQQKGIDYTETFASTSRMTTIRCMISLASQFGWKIHQLDIKTTFLNGDLHEEVYVSQPPGFEEIGKEHLVSKLNKALYGLKQAPRAWY
jgi:hypothetical protein